jgi:hypothetical protein
MFFVEKSGGKPPPCKLNYIQFPQKSKTFRLEGLQTAIICQGVITVVPEPFFGLLSIDPAGGVLPGDIVPGHEPPDPILPGCGDGNGDIAQLGQSTFKKTNGINGSVTLVAAQPIQNSGLDSAVGDPVQILQCPGIGKHNAAQLFPQKLAVYHSAGESGSDGLQQTGIGL